MKKCEKCGKEIMDDAVVCPDCEKSGEKSAPIINTDELRKRAEDIGSTIKNYDYNKLVPEAIKEKVPGKYQKFLPLGILAVFVLIFVFIISSCTGGYKKPVKYLEQISNGNYKNIDKMAPKDIWEDHLDYYDMTNSERIEAVEEQYEGVLDEQKDKYGDNYKISYDIKEKEKLSNKELSDIRDGLKANYNVPKKSVKKGYELKVKVVKKGSEDKDTNTQKLMVVKIDGDWYIVSANGQFIMF